MPSRLYAGAVRVPTRPVDLGAWICVCRTALLSRQRGGREVVDAQAIWEKATGNAGASTSPDSWTNMVGGRGSRRACETCLSEGRKIWE